MRKSFLLCVVVALTGLVMPVMAQVDPNIPDSAYFLQPQYSPNGCEGVHDASVEFYIWTDHGWEGFVVVIEFEFTWSGADCVDTIISSSPCLPEDALLYCNIDCEAKQGSVGYYSPVTPLECGVFKSEFRLTLSPDSTCQLEVVPGSILLDTWYAYWEPEYQDLLVTLTEPDPPEMVNGDADTSGEVDIDDVVYLLYYIFGGGCPPWYLNSGDVDASCGIDIDDVVYLIEFIFGGGPAPLPGCVQ